MRLSANFALLALLTLSWQAHAQLIDRSIAIVNHHVITESELIDESKSIIQQLSAKQMALPSIDELYKQVLEHLILKQAQEDLANQLGIRIRDEEVNERLTAVAAQNNTDLYGLRAQLEKKQPGSFVLLRDKVREELSIEALRQQEVISRIRVTPEEVKNFINRKLGTQNETERYEVQHMLIALPDSPSPQQIAQVKEKAMGIWQSLKDGGDFAQAAIRYSADSHALEGGKLGWLTSSELPGVIEPVVTHIAVGEVAEPIQSPLGFHIVKLMAKDNNAQSHIPADLEQQAFQILRTQKGNNLYEQWLRRVRDEAYVKILAPEYQRD